MIKNTTIIYFTKGPENLYEYCNLRLRVTLPTKGYRFSRFLLCLVASVFPYCYNKSICVVA